MGRCGLVPILFLCVFLVFACNARSDDVASSAQAPTEPETPQPERSLREQCQDLGIAYPPPDLSIVIRKSPRTLDLLSGDVIVKQYPVALGFEPVSDKRRQGDGATPEGDFYVCTKNPGSNFTRFLGLSYPNKEDAERGFEQGLITSDQRDWISSEIRRKRQPPWNTPLGGAVGIHGGGDRWDWTIGCIALSDEHILELFPLVPLGTPVTILP